VKTLFRVLFAVLAVAQVAYGKLPGRRSPAQTKGVVGLLAATSAAEAAAARGPARGLGLLGLAAGGGYAVELAGVATGRPFGHYHYSPKLGRGWRGVPFLVAAAWMLMARPAWVVGGLVAGRRGRAARVLAAAGALAAWDVFLDPRMVREGYWTWPQGGRYEGIPASNFVGWLVTGAGIFALWAALEGDDEALEEGEGDGALAVYLWTWAGEGFANAALWDRPRVALAGTGAMGAFAIPALLRRARR